MKVLVVGSGGREHALVWRLARDDDRPEILAAPGNAGTARLARNVPIDASDIPAVVGLAIRERPDLVLVGPEAPLCAGLADELRALDIPVVGPGRDGARIEGSKSFCKEILVAAQVPTARAEVFVRSDDAIQWIRRHGPPIVVKVDGLAAGKGVTVCKTFEEAEQAVRDALDRRIFGKAGETILIEEYLEGEEVSVLALVDGDHVALLPSAQDHKRAFDRDEGPNTGGMGAYSPAPVVPDPEAAEIRTRIVEPVIHELRRRGIEYRGVLYAGLMITRDGPKVLEFNCRFGDPETQALLPRWQAYFAQTLLDCARGRLNPATLRWRSEACVCVVLAAGGYPGRYEQGDVIEGIEDAERLEHVVVFHAGTAWRDGRLVTSGGRVLGVTAWGSTIAEAISQAYEAVGRIRFRNMQYRQDIGLRALRRQDERRHRVPE